MVVSAGTAWALRANFAAARRLPSRTFYMGLGSVVPQYPGVIAGATSASHNADLVCGNALLD